MNDQFQEKDRLKISFDKASTDYTAAAGQLDYYEELPSGDWTPFFTDFEKQLLRWDTNGCSMYSSIKTIQAQCNKLLADGKFSDEAIKFFTDNSYLVNGQFNFSIRFTATMSGTTINGNNPIYCFISAQKDGLIPEWMHRMTLEDSQIYESQIAQDAAFYSMGAITPEMRNMSLKSLRYIAVAYQWIGDVHYSPATLAQLVKAIKQAPPVFGIPVPADLSVYNSGMVKWDGKKNLEHCIGGVIVKIDPTDPYPYYFSDNYNPFTKRLSADYWIPQALQCIVTAITPSANAPIPAGWNITKALAYGSVGIQVFLLQNRLIQNGVAMFSIPTGFFGYATRDSLMAYQHKFNLQITGTCTPETNAHLQKWG